MDKRYPFVYGEREKGRKVERRNKRSTSFGKFSIFKQSLDLPEGYERGCKRGQVASGGAVVE
jgi:hypothetical protein